MHPEPGSTAHRDDRLEILGVSEGVEKRDGAPQRVPDQDDAPVSPLSDVSPQPLDVLFDAGTGITLGMAREIDRVGLCEESNLMLPRFPTASGTMQEDQLHVLTPERIQSPRQILDDVIEVLDPDAEAEYVRHPSDPST